MTGEAGRTGSTVIKGRHRPVHAAMTNLAGFCGGDMAGTLASRYHAVVAGGASTNNLGMIYPRHRQPAHRRMASITDIAAVDVSPSRVGLAGGNHSIVATLTGAHSLVVIHRACGRPGATAVAGLAHATSENMIRSLACGQAAIVTDNAALAGGAVIKHRHRPIDSAVT